MRYITLALAAAALVTSFAANAQVNINVAVPGIVVAAPPPPRVEPVPPPMRGQIWVPGRWQWMHSGYVWQRGYWQPERVGSYYTPGRWEQVRGGWRWVEGGWQRGDRHWDDHCPPGQYKKGRC